MVSVASKPKIREAKTSRERLRQVEAWLKKNFPAPYPVEIRVYRFSEKRFIKEDEIGECCKIQGENKLRISIHKGLPKYYKNETLLHEWTHAMLWPTTPKEIEKAKSARKEHPHPFWVLYEKIYVAWYDRTGWYDSKIVEEK